MKLDRDSAAVPPLVCTAVHVCQHLQVKEAINLSRVNVKLLFEYTDRLWTSVPDYFVKVTTQIATS